MPAKTLGSLANVTCLRSWTERAKLSPCTRPAWDFPLLMRKNCSDDLPGKIVGQDGGLGADIFFRWCCSRITRMSQERAASWAQWLSGVSLTPKEQATWGAFHRVT